MTTLHTEWPFEPVFGGLFSPQFTQNIFEEFDKPFEKAYDLKTIYPYDLIIVKGKNDETEKFLLNFALSGFLKEEISVKIIDDEIKIDIHHSREDTDNWKYVHKGIAQRSMKSTFKLGSLVDKENITMDYENGLLSIDIPVKQKESYEIKFK